LIRLLARLALAAKDRALADNHLVHVEKERADEAMTARNNPQDPSQTPPRGRLRHVSDTPARRALDAEIEDGSVCHVLHQEGAAADAEMIAAIPDTPKHGLISTGLNKQWHLVPSQLLPHRVHLAIVRWRRLRSLPERVSQRVGSASRLNFAWASPR
jgi:hypothetical protein